MQCCFANACIVFVFYACDLSDLYSTKCITHTKYSTGVYKRVLYGAKEHRFDCDSIPYHSNKCVLYIGVKNLGMFCFRHTRDSWSNFNRTKQPLQNRSRIEIIIESTAAAPR